MSETREPTRAPITYLIFVSFVVMAFVVGKPTPTFEDLVNHGAAIPTHVPGQPWRLLTFVLLHGNVVHLFVDSYFLLLIGPGLERRLGSLRFAGLYLISTLAAGVCSNLWAVPRTPLVGASGALFGLIGAGLALNMRRGTYLLDFLQYAGPRRLLVVIAANVTIGALMLTVSNAGHAGGLIAGFVLMFCFYEPGARAADALSRLLRASWVILLASLLFAAVRPVVRWDYLSTRWILSATDAQRAKYAEALLLQVDDIDSYVLGKLSRQEYKAALRADAEKAK